MLNGNVNDKNECIDRTPLHRECKINIIFLAARIDRIIQGSRSSFDDHRSKRIMHPYSLLRDLINRYSIEHPSKY